MYNCFILVLLLCLACNHILLVFLTWHWCDKQWKSKVANINLSSIWFGPLCEFVQLVQQKILQWSIEDICLVIKISFLSKAFCQKTFIFKSRSSSLDDVNSPTRIAMVQGPPDQVQRASQMITEIVEQVMCAFYYFWVYWNLTAPKSRWHACLIC